MVEFKGERYLIWDVIRSPGGRSSVPVAVLSIHLDRAEIDAKLQEATDSAGGTLPLHCFIGHIEMTYEALKLLPL